MICKTTSSRQAKRVVLLLFPLLLTACGIYKPYERPAAIDTAVQSQYRTEGIEGVRTDSAHLGLVAWREIFTDPYLQELIQAGLDNNFDLRNALLQVRQMRARLVQARMAYTPSLNLSGSYAFSGVAEQGASVNQPYSIALAGSWEFDVFGKVLNAKRAAVANFLQSDAGRREVQSQIISGIATAYYSLLMLDKQLELRQQTVQNWEATLKMMEALKLAGTTHQAAIEQARANSYAVMASIPDLVRQIRELENSLSLLTGRPGGEIARGKFDDTAPLPEAFSIGVPSQLFMNRPDVIAAEAGLMSTFYGTASARAAFFPSFTISANGNWTNSLGGAIVDPAKFVWQAALSLALPLLNKGTLTANLRVAKAQQEMALNKFQKTLLSAANDVSNALFLYQTAESKQQYRLEQVGSLEKAVEYTTALMKLGGSGHTYLEVLTAQQSLLNAQLSQIADQYERMGAVISLYRALGGGAQEFVEDAVAENWSKHKTVRRRAREIEKRVSGEVKAERVTAKDA